MLAAHEELFGLQMVELSDGRLKRGTVYVTLGRMQEKGYLESRQEPLPEGAIGSAAPLVSSDRSRDAHPRGVEGGRADLRHRRESAGGVMAITNRALAFVSRWFDEATVRRTFEPLIADWQREWQEASPAGRARVSLRGLAAFICAVHRVESSDRQTTAPSSVTNRVATRIARFTLPAATLLIIPFVTDARSESGSVALHPVDRAAGAWSLAFPFAMVGAVDAIRGHEPLPPHVERAVVAKLAHASPSLFMVCFHGWVVPAANQAWRANDGAGRNERSGARRS